jgi:hypothetical protein
LVHVRLPLEPLKGGRLTGGRPGNPLHKGVGLSQTERRGEGSKFIHISLRNKKREREVLLWQL